jgi:hypothetical protein
MNVGKRWEGTFRMVPDSLWQHPDLELIDLKVWCALMLHARDRAEIASTNASIAASVRASLPTLKRSLSRLAATGFVRPEGETTKRILHLCPDAIVVAYTLRIAN